MPIEKGFTANWVPEGLSKEEMSNVLERYTQTLFNKRGVAHMLKYPDSSHSDGMGYNIGPDADIRSASGSGEITAANFMIDGESQLGNGAEGGALGLTPADLIIMQKLNGELGLGGSIGKGSIEAKNINEVEGGREGAQEVGQSEKITAEDFVEALDPNSKTKMKEKRGDDGEKIFIDPIEDWQK